MVSILKILVPVQLYSQYPSKIKLQFFSDKSFESINFLPICCIIFISGTGIEFISVELTCVEPEAEEGAIPLFYSQHIKQGKVQFPIKKDHEYVVTDQKGLIQDNKNYLFVKRFTSSLFVTKYT